MSEFEPTQVGCEILRSLLSGPKRFSQILREIGVSKKGLSKSLKSLVEMKLIIRTVVANEKSSPAVFYEINAEHKERVRNIVRRPGVPKLDRYGRVQRIFDDILTSNENDMRKCLMLGEAMGPARTNSPFLGEFDNLLTELAWASRAFLNNDQETCRKLREHAKRNFTKLFHLVFELSGKNSFAINLAFAEANDEVSSKWEDKFKLEYPGGKRILEEAQHDGTLVGTDLNSLRDYADKIENNKSVREWFDRESREFHDAQE